MAIPTDLADLSTGPATSASLVTPSDATVLRPTRGLYVGGAGNLTVTMTDPDTAQATVLFTAVPAGTLLPISVEQVRSTGTTATAIVALF